MTQSSLNGMLFVVFNETGIVNHGVVVDEVSPNKFLIQFQVAPVSSRIVSVDELQLYSLFHDAQQRDVFIEAFMAQRTPKESQTVESTPMHLDIETFNEELKKEEFDNELDDDKGLLNPVSESGVVEKDQVDINHVEDMNEKFANGAPFKVGNLVENTDDLAMVDVDGCMDSFDEGVHFVIHDIDVAKNFITIRKLKTTKTYQTNPHLFKLVNQSD